MIFGPPGKPSGPKKAVYLLATTVLGVLLSFIIHALIEMGYLSWAQRHNVTVSFYNDCALNPWLQIVLLVGGAIGGFWLGQVWWRLLYVERVWAKGWLRG